MFFSRKLISCRFYFNAKYAKIFLIKLKIFFVRKGVSFSKGTVFYHPINNNLQYIKLINVLILGSLNFYLGSCIIELHAARLERKSFFCFGESFGKKDWERKAEIAAIKNIKRLFDTVK